MCNETGILDLVYIAFERQSSNISFKSSDDCTGLCPAPQVRLLKPQALPVLLQPVRAKRGNDGFTIGLPRVSCRRRESA